MYGACVFTEDFHFFLLGASFPAFETRHGPSNQTKL